MAHYAGALLYLVPVVVAGIVAFAVSRPDRAEKDRAAKDRADKDKAAKDEAAKARAATAELVAQQSAAKPVPPQRRAKDNVVAHPTLMHAALSTHLTAVAGARVHAGKHRTGSAQAASLAASVSAQHAAARLVSIRKPARIPRRPVHRCPHKP